MASFTVLLLELAGIGYAMGGLSQKVLAQLIASPSMTSKRNGEKACGAKSEGQLVIIFCTVELVACSGRTVCNVVLCGA